MAASIRRLAKIRVKTLTGSNLEVEMDLDDGEWRVHEGELQEITTDTGIANSTQESNSDPAMNIVDDSDSDSSSSAMKDVIETEGSDIEETMHTEEAKVKHLKQLVFEMQGIPPNQQRLVFQGKQLTDEDELDKTGLKDQTVHLVLALRGGCL